MTNKFFTRLFSLLFGIIVISSLAACATPEPADKTVGWTPERLIAEAKDEMSSGNWSKAIPFWDKLEARYPFGKYAQQAQIEVAYCHYKDNDRGQALVAVDRFLRLHPNNDSTDYAYYLRGLINFNEQQGFLSTLGGQDLSERDLKAAREAFDSFKTLINRFPESKYSADASARMKYLVNSMALGEVNIARYYFLKGAYVAAANRAQAVVKQYQQAPAIEEALYIMVRSYDQLGLTDLKDDADRVYKQNFPKSTYALTGVNKKDNGSWWQFWK
jgi:outer membrane protein assembly factor BamD